MSIKLLLRGLDTVVEYGRGLAGLKSSVPYFSEAERLFTFSPRLLMQERGDRLTHPYGQHAWVYSSIRAISMNIAGVDLLLYTGDREDKTLVEGHAAADLIAKPNPYMSWQLLAEATVTFLELTGEAFWIVERASDRVLPEEIWCFDPRRFEEVVDEKTGLIVGWKYRKGSQTVPLEAHEVVFFKYFNPYNDYRGMGPLEATRLGVEQDYLASQYNKAFFQNHAQLGGFLETDQNLMPEEFTRVLAQFNQKYAGASKAWKVALLEGGVKYKAGALSQKDMDFLEQRKWGRDEILATFKVPKGEVGIYEDINYATARTQDKVFWTKTLMPKMAMIEWVFYNQILEPATGGNLWAEFDYGSIDVLEDDFQEKVESAQKLFGMGVPLNTINERLNLGLPDVPGGEVGYLPFNLSPAGESEPAPEYEPPESGPPEEEPEEGLGASARAPAGEDEKAWKAYVKLHERMEAKVRGKMKRYFWEQRKLQLRLIEEKLGGRDAKQQVDLDTVLFPLDRENARLQEVLWPLYIEVANASGQAIFTEMGVMGDLFNVQDTQAIAELHEKLIKVVGINRVTREKLRGVIRDAMVEMEPWTEVAKRVREVYNFTASRAQTIARTEVGQSMMVARYAGMAQLGVGRISWVCAMDERVRVSHLNMHGKTVLLGTQFPNGCRFPSDPQGPASEVINCRCLAMPEEEPRPQQPSGIPKFEKADTIEMALARAKEYGAKVKLDRNDSSISWYLAQNNPHGSEHRSDALQILNDINEQHLAMRRAGLKTPKRYEVLYQVHGTHGTVCGNYTGQTLTMRLSLTKAKRYAGLSEAFNPDYPLAGDGEVKWSTMGSTVWHEGGHHLHRQSAGTLAFNKWRGGWPKYAYGGTEAGWKRLSEGIAQKVSFYATTNPLEFVAEVYRGMRNGKTYGEDIMRIYEKFRGPEVVV